MMSIVDQENGSTGCSWRKKIEWFDQRRSQDCVLLVRDGREPWERGWVLMRLGPGDRFLSGGGRRGFRWCGFALFLVRFCGNFYFNSRYCGFKTLSGLRLLQPLSRGFRWKKVSAVITLFRTVGIRLFLQARAKCFVLQRFRVHCISLQFNSVVCNYGLFQLILNVINRFGQWCVDFVKFHAGC